MQKKAIIFGAGISGSTLARYLAENNYLVTIYEKNNFVGGNCFDFVDDNNILIHKYGPHIFHTSNEEVYAFINRFCKLNGFINEVLVDIDNKKYPLPFNFESIDLKYGNEKSQDIKDKLLKLFPNQKNVSIFQLTNSTDNDIKELGTFVFENVFANYSSKMWGIPIEKIDKNIINRVGITIGYERSYFPNDKYQGLPINGYTNMIRSILNHENIKIILNSKNVLKIDNNKTLINNKLIKDNIFYCGPIDELFDYVFGELPYRSLNIIFESFNKNNYQSNAVINYPSHPTMTRITEYKKMTFQNDNGWTTISKEFPGEYGSSKKFNQRYYPIANKKSLSIYKKYVDMLKKCKNLHLLGRLAQYKYFDMDDAILEAINLAKLVINNN